jgi:hypothetical protein
MKEIMIKKIVAISAIGIFLQGCTTIATNTNMLSDQTVKTDVAGVLGYAPSEITVISRRTEGNNTYATVKTSNGSQYGCVMSGGSILTLGMSNPPMCTKRE